MRTGERHGCFDRVRLVVLASTGVAMMVAGGACAHGTCGDAASAPSPGARPSPSGSTAALPPAPAPAPAAFCGRLARDNDAALATLSAAGHPVVAAWRRAAVCTPSGRGAWGLSIASVTADGSEVWARWSLRHLRVLPDASSREDPPFAPETMSPVALPADREPPAERQNLTWSAERRIVPVAPVLFDFDGDGDAELVAVVETVDVNESGLTHITRRGRVWSAHDAAIALYPAARDIAVEDVRDVDGDGRPDLLTRGPYAGSATVTCGSEDPYPVLGPLLVAHAAAGGAFSWHDAVAVDWAHRACGVAPAPVMRPEPHVTGAVDLVASARNIACARLWGASTEALVTEVTAACHRSDGAACAPCDDAALLERWARVPPPLLIPTPAHTAP